MAFTATDLFLLGSPFSVQSSSTRGDGGERAQVLAADGDVACESAAFNVGTEYSAEYQHCGTANDINTDLDAVVTVPVGGPLEKFGCYMNSQALLTELELTMSNKDYPTLRLTGHDHAVNPHTGSDVRTFEIGDLIPAVQGIGIPTLLSADNLISFAATSTPTEVVMTASLQHMESEKADGDHFRGQNRTCMIEVRVSGVGTQADVTFASNWKTGENDDGDSNQEDDTFSISAHQFIAAT